MNKFYRKPKPETMKKNRESYSEIFKQEISWLKGNLQTLTESKNKFLIDMYTILITGSRKITPKMASAIKNGIETCKNSPLYNPELQAEAEAKQDEEVDFRNVCSFCYIKEEYHLCKVFKVFSKEPIPGCAPNTHI